MIELAFRILVNFKDYGIQAIANPADSAMFDGEIGTLVKVVGMKEDLPCFLEADSAPTPPPTPRSAVTPAPTPPPIPGSFLNLKTPGPERTAGPERTPGPELKPALALRHQDILEGRQPSPGPLG